MSGENVKEKIRSFEPPRKPIVYKLVDNSEKPEPKFEPYQETKLEDIKYDNFSNDRIDNPIKNDKDQDPVIVFDPTAQGAPFKGKNGKIQYTPENIDYHEKCSFYELLNYYFCCCNDFLKNYE